MDFDNYHSPIADERIGLQQLNAVDASRLQIALQNISARRYTVIMFLVALPVCFYIWTSYFVVPNGQSTVTQLVVRGDVEKTVTAVGKLEATRSVDVGVQVSGLLKTLSVQIGDKVQAGQAIAEIDPASIEHRLVIDEAELSILQAQRTAKKAQVALKETNLTRQRALISAKSISQSTMDQANADLIIARADLEATEAQFRKQEATIASDRVDLGYTKIYAPFTGTVISNSAKQGQTLNANQTAPTIITIADLTTMVVKAQVSEADIGNLKIGMEAYFTLIGEAGKRYLGRLQQIQPVPNTDNNVVLYDALFEVSNKTGELMLSMSAQVFFLQAAARNVLVIPTVALRSETGPDGDVFVLVEKPNGAVEHRRVEVGLRNRVTAEIKVGLAEGESIISSSDREMIQGDKSAPGATF